MIFEKLSVEHIPYFYDIRFSVNENMLLPQHIKYLQREQLVDDIEQGGGWICRYDNKFVGVGFGVFVPEPLVGGLFVKPEYQSMGIGSKLLALVTNWFFERDVKEIMLTTDSGSKAESFYKRRGWYFSCVDEFGQSVLIKGRGE
ncbi:GNAT family N-acetyltransferase [Salmonella enterica subsp. enterica serovar Shubra]|nr:GNAT family N-acetyltransferase [Salmonella enterica subsp. enterica serovar Shubra]